MFNKNPIKKLKKRSSKMVGVVRRFNDLVYNLMEDAEDVLDQVEEQRMELLYVEEEAEETQAFARKLAQLLK